jgi:lysozyme
MNKINKTRFSIALIIFGLLLALIVRGATSLLGWMGTTISDDEIISSESAEKIYYKDCGIPVPNNYSVHGIDISKHQNKINWKQVEEMQVNGEKLAFVFIKASEGATRNDDYFQKNWKSAGKTKLLRGAYHFFRPVKDSRIQAFLFMHQLKLKKGDLPPVVDIERGNRQSTKHIQESLKDFLDVLEHEYSVKPIIYTNLSFYTKHLAGKFDDYPIWIAYYKDDPFQLPGNKSWSFWQHSECGRVNGIRGMVDFNVFHGNIGQLRAMCIK